MTRSDALRALLAKVEAGEWDDVDDNALWTLDADDIEQTFGSALTSQIYRGWHAYAGSLDAAKALHEAVLPGWDWGRSAASGQFYVWNTGEGPASAMSNNEDPARAWLICILKALIATEDN